MYEYLKPLNGPVVAALESQETVYAADQTQYIHLRTLRADGPMGGVISRWTLTPEQRKAVADGADVFLELSTGYNIHTGRQNPLQPIRMVVSDASGDRFADWFKVCILNQGLNA